MMAFERRRGRPADGRPAPRARWQRRATYAALGLLLGLAGCTSGSATGGVGGSPSAGGGQAAGNVVADPLAKVGSWSMAVSRDESRIAAPCLKHVCLWDTASGRLVGSVPGAGVVALSPDGAQLATQGVSNGTTGALSVRVVSVPGGAVIAELAGHTFPKTTDGLLGLTAAAYSPDGTVLATAAHDGTVRLWSTSTWAALRVLEPGGSRPTAVAFSPDGSRLAVASSDAPASIWAVATGARQATLTSASRQGYGITFTSDGLKVATGVTDPDQAARVIDIATGSVTAAFPGSVTAHGFAASSAGDLIAFSDTASRAVIVWPLSGSAPRRLVGHTDAPHAVAFSPDGTSLYSASSHDGILRWDPVTGTLVARFELPI